jgi:hypothetical protein
LAGVVGAGTIGAEMLSAVADQVDLCHAKGNGSYQAISVNDKALPAHLSHGDVQQPNGAVPSSTNSVFDAACQVVSWVYAENVAVDVSAQDPASPGNLFAGNSIPATGFGTATNSAAGVELGLQIIYRQGPTVLSTDTYADGVLEYEVADGPQSTANGSFVNNANRAAWSFQPSVATGLGGATTDLGDFTFQLLYDVDPAAGTTYRTLQLQAETTPQGAGQSGYEWVDLNTTLAYVSDDEGNAYVTQNSQNYAFLYYQFFMLPPGYGLANNFAGPARFDIILQAFSGAQLIARNHIAVNVQP